MCPGIWINIGLVWGDFIFVHDKSASNVCLRKCSKLFRPSYAKDKTNQAPSTTWRLQLANMANMTTGSAPASATAMSERRFLLLMILARSLNASGLGLLFSASTDLLYRLTHSGRVAPVRKAALWKHCPGQNKDNKSIQQEKEIGNMFCIYLVI